MKVTHSGQLTVDLGLESNENPSLSCSDSVDLYVDLRIEEEGQVESSTATVSQAQNSEKQVHESEKMKICTGVQKNLARSDPPVEVSNVSNVEGCDSRTGKDGREIGTLSESKINWFQSTWPDWVEPLTPAEIYVDCSFMENTHVLRKAVTFSDEVTFLEPVEPVTSVQEEREADSFSYSDCSDDDTDVGASKVNDRPSIDVSSSRLAEECILNPADMSAAYQLLNMSNVPRFKDLDSGEDVNTGIALSEARYFPEVYDPTDDLDKLSGLVDKIYAAVPQLHTAAASYGRYLRESEGGVWTVMDIAKNSGVFKLKRLKRDRESWDRKPKFVYVDSDSSADNEVLKRPPWKRMYKSLRTLA